MDQNTPHMKNIHKHMKNIHKHGLKKQRSISMKKAKINLAYGTFFSLHMFSMKQ